MSAPISKKLGVTTLEREEECKWESNHRFVPELQLYDEQVHLDFSADPSFKNASSLKVSKLANRYL